MLKLDNIKKKFLQSIDIIENTEKDGFTYLKTGSSFSLEECDENINECHHDVTRYVCDGCTMTLTSFRDKVVAIRVIKDGIIYDINESVDEYHSQIISFTIGTVSPRTCVATIRMDYMPYAIFSNYEDINSRSYKFLRTHITINDISSLPQVMACAVSPDNEMVMNITGTEEKFDVEKYESHVSQAICSVKNDGCRNYLSNNVRFLSSLIPILLLRKNNEELDLSYAHEKNRVYNSYAGKMESASLKPSRFKELERKRDKNIRELGIELARYTDMNDMIIGKFKGKFMSHQKLKHPNEV